MYHYTSADGLNGIFEGHSVWASSITYLNDEDEFGSAFRRMTKLLKILARTRPEFDHLFARGVGVRRPGRVPYGEL